MTAETSGVCHSGVGLPGTFPVRACGIRNSAKLRCTIVPA